MEETTTGVIRLRAMEKDGALRIPVVAVNDAQTKYLFDNRYGTGQSTVEAIIRATGILVAGSVFVVAGYGWCGRGVASRARGLGANVIVTEVNPIRALEAAMDGFRVMRMAEAAQGRRRVRHRHRRQARSSARTTSMLMKDGAIICNSGHFDVEIDMRRAAKLARKVDKGRDAQRRAYHLRNGSKLYLLGQGRLVNLACAEGHPAQVMDMSFATQALAARVGRRARKSYEVKVHDVPLEIEDEVAA